MPIAKHIKPSVRLFNVMVFGGSWKYRRIGQIIIHIIITNTVTLISSSILSSSDIVNIFSIMILICEYTIYESIFIWDLNVVYLVVISF